MTSNETTRVDRALCHLGVDVGGTFTDIVLHDESGRLHCLKVASTPSEPGASTLRGIDEFRRGRVVSDSSWETIQHTHSGTVATNALLEGRGAKLGLLVTEGLRDILELQRLALPHPMRFDSRRPTPLVPRRYVREVRERIDVDGRVRTPLDVDGLLASARHLVDAGVEAIVVCFLHSYSFPRHEQLARDELARAFPGIEVSVSSEVWPQAREYERATVAVINSFVRPTVEHHMRRLLDGLAGRGLRTPARASRSNGGAEVAETLMERPVTALLSGPAAGVAGAAWAASQAGISGDLVTFDVGGTSADIGVVRGGRPILSAEEEMAGFPLLIPTVAVSAIGAGGGSILWVDETSTLRVGPKSAGAYPAPACYGVSESAPAALTDALLVTGLLEAGQLLGGRIRLLQEPAQRELTALGDTLGWSASEVADGAVSIAAAVMAANMTKVLARRGVDASEATLVAYGGAGPLLAGLVADECNVARVLVPALPGALSALGATFADLEGDLVEPVHQRLRQMSPESIAESAEALERRADEWISRQGKGSVVLGVELQFSAELRFDGQGYDTTLPLTVETLRAGDRETIEAAFHRACVEAYGRSSQAGVIWLTELRVHVTGRTPKPPPRSTVGADRGPNPRTPVERSARTRPVTVNGAQLDTAVYQRSALGAGRVIPGPAIIEQMDTTTFVPPRWTGTVGDQEEIVLMASRSGGGSE